MGRAAKRATHRTELIVTMTCEWCGKDIRLLVGALGSEIEDVEEFLAVHGGCLAGHPASPNGGNVSH